VNTLLLNVLLAIAWIALTGTFTPVNLLFGFVVGYLALGLTQRDSRSAGYRSKFPRVITFILFFLVELLLANLRVAYMVLSPRLTIRPAVVAIPLEATSDLEISLLANLITLTPGTLYLDISDDRKTMFVHTIYLEDVDQFRDSIKQGFERRLLEITR
jgi:multicomponent Na+:H+ antiporter subunit E